MTTNPNGSGFFMSGPAGSSSGSSTTDLHVTSGVVTDENLVLTLSNQSTVSISLAAVFTSGALTGVSYNPSTDTLTINQGANSFSTTLPIDDQVSTASITYDVATSSLILVESNGSTFSVPFPTIIEDIYDNDGNQLTVTTHNGRTRVTLPDFITQQGLEDGLATKQDTLTDYTPDVWNAKQDALGDYTPSVWNAKQDQITRVDAETVNIPGVGNFSGGTGTGDENAIEGIKTSDGNTLPIDGNKDVTLPNFITQSEVEEFAKTSATTTGVPIGKLPHVNTVTTANPSHTQLPTEAAVVDALETLDDQIDVKLDNKQEKIDGMFFVSTAAQRALDPPAGEFGLYSDYNGTPVLEHTQPMNARGIRGVGNGFAVPGSSEGEILYDDWEVVSSGGSGNVSIEAYSSVKEYSLGDIVYTLNSGVAHVYVYINSAASTGMDPETPVNNTHWDAMGVDEIVATQSGTNVEIHLARADALLTNPNAGMAVAIENENVGHSDLLNWEASNGVLVLNVDGLVDALANVSGVTRWDDSAAWEAQTAITLDINDYISTSDSYNATQADTDLAAAGYTDGDKFFIISRDTEYQVISTGGNLALQFILTNRDSLAVLDGGQSVLDDISNNTTAITSNDVDIEALTEHNHEQDARIAALEHRDFTTTISSFDADATLSSFFTSGTVTNKGISGSNLYEAWTITREGHELVGYFQFTDTERDSFRNEFSLIQGSNSSIYIPANPDAPHTIGIKAFPAADFNDLSSSTQVILGQISSMRFNGTRGSETSFEVRWELLNYSDAIDTGLGTVDSGEIYGAAGDKRYAFLATTIYTTPAWEFREATVSRTEIVTGGSITVNTTSVTNPIFLDNNDADGIHFEIDGSNIKANLNHLPGAAYNSTFSYRTGDEVTFNGTVYISLTNQSNVPPIDGGDDNNVFHGVGTVPDNGFAWRIAKAGIVVGTFDPDAAEGTVAETDLITAESIHFNADQFILTTDLTNGNENVTINPAILGEGGGGSTIRVDSVTVDNPNFVDNAISTTTARGVAFGADAQGNIIAQVDVTGLSGMGESALSGNTAGGLVKVNAAQDGFDDAVAGTDYQAPLTAGTDYQTPLTAGTDYQTPLTAGTDYQIPIVDGSLPISRTANLQTMLDGKENAITYSPNAPSSPSVGDLWIDTGDGSQFRYASGDASSNHWIQVAGQGENSTSAIASQIGDFTLTANGSGSSQTLDFQTGGVVVARLTKTGQWTTLNEQTDNDGTAL